MKREKPVQPKKAEIVSNITEKMKNAASVVFVDYTGLDMKTQQTLKNQLKEIGGDMIVVKNTLLKIAAQNAGLPDDSITATVLSGQTAVVLSDTDPVAPLQLIGKFMADNEKPKWKAGVVEGSFQDKVALVRISKLPSKETLISQVVGGISSPLYGLTQTLGGTISKLVWILQAKSQQTS